MGDLGMVGIPVPEKYGGGGMDWLSIMVAIEEISRDDASLGVSMPRWPMPRRGNSLGGVSASIRSFNLNWGIC
jgi:alkylation response protein AidB-like acyl-CoA dehydrogenase